MYVARVNVRSKLTGIMMKLLRFKDMEEIKGKQDNYQEDLKAILSRIIKHVRRVRINVCIISVAPHTSEFILIF